MSKSKFHEDCHQGDDCCAQEPYALIEELRGEIQRLDEELVEEREWSDEKELENEKLRSENARLREEAGRPAYYSEPVRYRFVPSIDLASHHQTAHQTSYQTSPQTSRQTSSNDP